MTSRRPLDSEGNPPMEGQTDIYDALHEAEREDGVPGPKEERRPPAEHRTLSASEVVALRLKGKQ